MRNIICGAVAFIVASAAHASDFHSPRTAALGGAGRAGPILNDSIYLNPSFASFVPSYSISFAGTWFKGPSTEPDGSSFFHGRNLNASVQDGRSELFQAGVGYSRTETMNQIHVGASRLFVKRFGFGIGGKVLLPKDGGDVIRDSNLSASVIVSEWLQAVVMIDNLFASGAARGLHREFALGTKVNVSQIVLIYFDPHITPGLLPGSIYGHETGVEFVMMSDVFLRLGAFRNAWIPFQESRGNGFGAGLGWIGPRMSFDWGISRVLSPSPATSQVFGMTLYF